MIEYKYKKVEGYEQKKFTENGHTMFEFDVLQRLKRLAYLEEKNKELEYLIKDVSEWNELYSSTNLKLRAKKLLNENKNQG